MSTKKQRHWRTLSYMAFHGYVLNEIVYNENIRTSSSRIRFSRMNVKGRRLGYEFLESLPNVWKNLPFERSWEGEAQPKRPIFKFTSSEGVKLSIPTWKCLGLFVNLHQRDKIRAEKTYEEDSDFV